MTELIFDNFIPDPPNLMFGARKHRKAARIVNSTDEVVHITFVTNQFGPVCKGVQPGAHVDLLNYAGDFLVQWVDGHGEGLTVIEFDNKEQIP